MGSRVIMFHIPRSNALDGNTGSFVMAVSEWEYEWQPCNKFGAFPSLFQVKIKKFDHDDAQLNIFRVFPSVLPPSFVSDGERKSSFASATGLLLLPSADFGTDWCPFLLRSIPFLARSFHHLFCGLFNLL